MKEREKEARERRKEAAKKDALGLLLSGEGGDVAEPAGDVGVAGGVGLGANKVQQLDVSLGGLEAEREREKERSDTERV